MKNEFIFKKIIINNNEGVEGSNYLVRLSFWRIVSTHFPLYVANKEISFTRVFFFFFGDSLKVFFGFWKIHFFRSKRPIGQIKKLGGLCPR